MQLKSVIKEVVKKIADAVFPRGLVCIRCGCELGEESRALEICPECMEYLPFSLDEGEGERLPFDSIDGLYYNLRYKDFSRDMVLRFKDSGDTYLKYNMAKLMRLPEEQIDYVAYVPSSAQAIRKRGYDHARLLAKQISQDQGLGLVDALTRLRQSGDSATMSKAERADNIKDAFSVSNTLDADTLKGKTILLIDDILTTGATASECAKVLKGCGVKRVLVSVFARA